MTSTRNVLGGSLLLCGHDPVTGFYRDGCCETGPDDLGSHTVCASVTAEFLRHQAERGNDLTRPGPSFRGLAPGDRWCVCVSRWKQALDDGLAPPVHLAATHERALDVVTLQQLEAHAVDVPDDASGATDPAAGA